MIVRDAVKEDFKQMGNLFILVDNLHSEAHPDVFKHHESNVRSDEYLSSIISNENQKLIVVTDKGKIVGLAEADIEWSPDIPLFVKREWINISTIVVDNNYRGKGVGQLLLNKLYEWANQKGINEVELSVFLFNEGAIRFYEKNGFKEIRKKMHKKIDLIKEGDYAKD